MKSIIYFYVLLFSFSVFSQSGKLVVEIGGFKNNIGLARIVLFNQKKGFPSQYTYGFLSNTQSIDTFSITVTFDSLAFGDYALSVLHDENENGKMDLNFLGIPKEGYGVSNNVHPIMRSPRYEEALFSLKESQKKIKIILNYR